MEKDEQQLIEKRDYLPPELRVEVVIMEYSLAAQSAAVNITGGAANNQPDITDWTDQGTTGDGTAEF